ncbi:hypothetical protein [Kocuria carniphila]|uniref:hypothetical protein n=1 Tax=Kocuria carniphila TaxID=262208 RepID=UPI0028E4F068|nr:hypothetical protein [Kocuria carniphila]
MRLLVIILFGMLGLAMGVAGMILGEGDDSPGLQGIGVLLALGSVTLTARALRRRSRQAP